MQQGVKLSKRLSEGERDSRWTVLPRSTEAGAADHGLNWLDARDGLFGEGEAEGNGSEQLAVDIHRAAAHTLENAGLSKRTTAQSGEDDGLPWSEILEDTEDLNLEVFDSITLEDSFADSSKSGADVLDWEKILTSPQTD